MYFDTIAYLLLQQTPLPERLEGFLQWRCRQSSQFHSVCISAALMRIQKDKQKIHKGAWKAHLGFKTADKKNGNTSG